ncbi:MAG: hypothetical protein KBG28_10575 [Kofleriaceae bacterium]|nr:hypothetical protein [Kofleriaceae bacterium]MBP6837158.1 hypothetical protein [Kofleriaceae bacterium]MBP9204400.1 hypothetical protein [Kofleriaceae bacterium]
MPRPADVPADARRIHRGGSTYYVRGEQRAVLSDAYHWFLRMSWPLALLVIAGLFLTINLAFGLAYLTAGGVAGARPGSFLDALSFSIQTMATIGYGVMNPVGAGANVLMIAESIVGIVFSALATGLVFAKFSRATTRVAFSRVAVIGPHDGVRTLMFRIANQRSNAIVEATVHVVATMTTTTQEGSLFFRSHDLRLVRDRHVGMTRGWMVMHVIDETSPLHGLDAAGLAAREVELSIALTGIDETSTQTVHTRHHYDTPDLLIDHRFVDTLRPLADGSMFVDLTQFHHAVPVTTSASVSAPVG